MDKIREFVKTDRGMEFIKYILLGCLLVFAFIYEDGLKQGIIELVKGYLFLSLIFLIAYAIAMIYIREKLTIYYYVATIPTILCAIFTKVYLDLNLFKMSLFALYLAVAGLIVCVVAIKISRWFKY